MKIIALGVILLFSMTFLGCKRSDQTADTIPVPPPPQVAAPEKITLTGQILLATKLGANAALVDVGIYLIDKKALDKYYDSKASEWETNLVAIQSNINQELAEYKELDASNLYRLEMGRKYWENKMSSAQPDDDNYMTAMLWEQKINTEFDGIFAAKHASAIKKQLDDNLEIRSNYWNNILSPKADVYTYIDTTTSDSQGNFIFTLDSKYQDSLIHTNTDHNKGYDVWILAHASHGDEKYDWFLPVGLYEKTNNIILSDQNGDLERDFSEESYQFQTGLEDMFSATNAIWFNIFKTNFGRNIEQEISSDEHDIKLEMQKTQ